MARRTDPLRDNAVRAHRRLAELTQADLAGQVGVSRQTIVAVENGGYAPSVYLALALADALGTTVEALFAKHGTERRKRRREGTIVTTPRPDDGFFDRVTARIGDLDDPFYAEERDRDVWNEASAVGFQLLLWVLLVAGLATGLLRDAVGDALDGDPSTIAGAVVGMLVGAGTVIGVAVLIRRYTMRRAPTGDG